MNVALRSGWQIASEVTFPLARETPCCFLARVAYFVLLSTAAGSLNGQFGSIHATTVTLSFTEAFSHGAVLKRARKTSAAKDEVVV